MAGTRHEEVERKYTVSRDAALPDLRGVDGVAASAPSGRPTSTQPTSTRRNCPCCGTVSRSGAGSGESTRDGT